MEVFPITPLLVFEIIIVSVIIWLVSLAAIKVPYSSDKLINEQDVFETDSLQERYMNAMSYYPLKFDINKSFVNNSKISAVTDQTGNTSHSDQSSDPSNMSTIESGADSGEPGESGEPDEGEPDEGDGSEPDEGDASEPSATRG